MQEKKGELRRKVIRRSQIRLRGDKGGNDKERTFSLVLNAEKVCSGEPRVRRKEKELERPERVESLISRGGTRGRRRESVHIERTKEK